jgi:hypothetical protein
VGNNEITQWRFLRRVTMSIRVLRPTQYGSALWRRCFYAAHIGQLGESDGDNRAPWLLGTMETRRSGTQADRLDPQPDRLVALGRLSDEQKHAPALSSPHAAGGDRLCSLVRKIDGLQRPIRAGGADHFAAFGQGAERGPADLHEFHEAFRLAVLDI